MKTEELNKQLCPKCKTGADSYLLDNKSSVCPYMHLHNGKSCPMFKEMNTTK